MGLTLREIVRAGFKRLKGHPAHQGFQRGIVAAQAPASGRHSRGNPRLNPSEEHRQALRLPRRPGHRIAHRRGTGDAEAVTLLAMATIAQGQGLGGHRARLCLRPWGGVTTAAAQARGEHPRDGEGTP